MLLGRQEFGFLTLSSGKVITAETLIVKVEGIETVCVRVSHDGQDGTTYCSSWFPMGMDERTALARMARRLKATLHYVGTCDG